MKAQKFRYKSSAQFLQNEGHVAIVLLDKGISVSGRASAAACEGGQCESSYAGELPAEPSACARPSGSLAQLHHSRGSKESSMIYICLLTLLAAC